jgi:hypothetical protein
MANETRAFDLDFEQERVAIAIGTRADQLEAIS